MTEAFCKRTGLRKKVVALLLATPLTVFLSILCYLSLHYCLSPLYVSKALARHLALEGIGIAVSLWGDEPERTATGPGGGPQVGTGDSLERLRSLLGAVPPRKIWSLAAYDNGSITYSRHRFGYQPAADKNLARLREVAAGGGAPVGNEDFAQILALSDWVNGRWQHGSTGSFDPAGFDARSVLAQAEKGARFWCHVSAMTLIQVAASMGYQGRLVSLSRDGYLPEHAVTEFWSNRYRKWFMVDPDFNILYTKDGKPLSVLEIHDALIEGEKDGPVVVRGANRPIAELERRLPRLIDYYRFFEVDMRNDWLSRHYFPGHPARSDGATLVWRDHRLPPILTYKPAVTEPSELYWDLNRTHLDFGRRSASWRDIWVSLETFTPNFSRFEVTVDGAVRTAPAGDGFLWTLHDGENSLEVRSVNAHGVKGVPGRVVLVIEDAVQVPGHSGEVVRTHG